MFGDGAVEIAVALPCLAVGEHGFVVIMVVDAQGSTRNNHERVSIVEKRPIKEM